MRAAIGMSVRGLAVAAASALCLASPVLTAEKVDVYLSLEEAPKVMFPDADRVERKDVASDESLRGRMKQRIGRLKPSIWEPFYISFTAYKQDQVIGYAVVCEEIGKHRPITFIVATTPDRVVKNVSVMMYREPIGGEIRHRAFLKQFAAKNLDHPIAARRDIKNISGATLSVRAMSRGVRKALAFLEETYGNSSTEAGESGAALRDPARAPGEKEHLVQRAHYVMGTIFEMRGYGQDRKATAEAFEAAFAEIRKVDELLSHYRDDSALARLNREAARGPVEVAPELYDVLAVSRKFAELSDGAFDVTAGALVRLWESAEQAGRLPTDEERQQILRRVDWRRVELLDDGRVRFRTSGVQVNFGAIGKGWALDRALEVLEARGVRNAFLSAGTSTVYAMGSDRSGRGWRIALRDPLRPDEREVTAFYVRDGAVSTSADYERSLVIENKRYSHIIDPRSGLPVGAASGPAAEKILSATVQAPKAAEADALSTAVFVMGLDRGRDFLKRIGRQGQLIGVAGGEIRHHRVGPAQTVVSGRSNARRKG